VNELYPEFASFRQRNHDSRAIFVPLLEWMVWIGMASTFGNSLNGHGMMLSAGITIGPGNGAKLSMTAPRETHGPED
jgi:hypothetical protein